MSNTIWEKSVDIEFEVAGIGIKESAWVAIIKDGTELYFEFEVAGQGKTTKITSLDPSKKTNMGTLDKDKVCLDLNVADRVEVEACLKNLEISDNQINAEIVFEVCINPPHIGKRCRDFGPYPVEARITT